jgi:Phage integrase family
LKAGIARACRKAKIEGVTWHTRRHTFASRLVNRGVDIVTVQQLLKHSAITVTMRYTRTNLDSKHAAVAKLEKCGDSVHQIAAVDFAIVTKRVVSCDEVDGYQRRGGREAEGGALLIHPALFVLTTFHLFGIS